MTLKSLYQERTRDLQSHPRAIHARFQRLSPRRKQLITRLLKGETYRDIGNDWGVTAGTIQKTLNQAMESIRKSIAGEPRYNRTGHKRGGRRKASVDN